MLPNMLNHMRMEGELGSVSLRSNGEAWIDT